MRLLDDTQIVEHIRLDGQAKQSRGIRIVIRKNVKLDEAIALPPVGGHLVTFTVIAAEVLWFSSQSDIWCHLFDCDAAPIEDGGLTGG